MYQLLEDKSAQEFLRKSAAIYEALVDRVLSLHQQGDREGALTWIQLAANFAWQFHPGRFADGTIENVALEIGRELESVALTNESQPRDKRRVLHVATSVSRIGGHTRLISNWIENDADSRHSLLLLSQQDAAVPEWLRLATRTSGGTLTSLLPNSPLLEKATQLRAFARAQADIVVLHQHPDDVLPVVAFASDGGPSVAIMNHADHVFWLGTSIADVVLNVREFGQRLSAERRLARHNLLLPVPLGSAASPASGVETRSPLGIGETEVVMLSVGGSYKYAPTKTHHFFKTIRKILKRNERAHLYVVGVPDNRALQHVREYSHERMHLLGTVDDPTPYYRAADIYLEGFPYGSMTALLEAAMMGVSPVLMYAPIPQADVSDDLGLKGIIRGVESEEKYIAQVSDLIEDRDKRKRLGEQVAARVASAHRGEIWQECLLRVYEQLKSTTHESSEIPNSVRADLLDDLGLSAFALNRKCSSLLQTLANQNSNRLSVGDVLWLLFLARRMKDGEFSDKENSNWGELLQTRAEAGHQETAENAKGWI